MSSIKNKIIAGIAGLSLSVLGISAHNIMTVSTTGLISSAHASTCTSEKVRDDLDDADIAKLYECMSEKMVAAYTKKGDAEAGAYRNWKAASTQPGIAATHGNRFVHTFVNDIGYDEYVKFSDEEPVMPVGTIIAKESFSVGKKKPKVKVGPLFFMTKVEKGTADEFGNWVYRAIAPNGKQMKIKQTFCHQCHQNYDDQDSLGYPGDDYRITN